MLHRRCAQTSGHDYTHPMALIEVEVEEGENSDMSLVRIFDSIEEPREITCVVALRRDGTEGPCAVTGWSSDGPCPARAAPVWDSGDGVALLIYGGDEGIRLKHQDSTADWDITDASQWGEPCLLMENGTAIG
jgi:hypothetical protein